MRKFLRPRVLVSRCLEFDNVRYDGKVIPSKIVRDLIPLVDFVKVCPEVEIGMGIPRNPIRIVKDHDSYSLIQPKTGEDVTEKMDSFITDFMRELAEMDGFIFKAVSPTIGIRNIKVYAGIEMAPVVEKGSGFFTKKIIEKYDGFPMEEDDRLRNHHIRHHFLTQLYIFSEFRNIHNLASTDKLIEFNERNRYLFTCYNHSIYQQMSNLLLSYDPDTCSVSEDERFFTNYLSLMKELMRKPGGMDSKISVFRQLFSIFSNKVPENERISFENLLENYSENRISEDAVIEILRVYTLRFDEGNIDSYSLLYPYPEVLRISGDEKRDKDYWDNGE